MLLDAWDFTGSAVDKAAKRDCLPCTACCRGWLWAEIKGHKVSAGNPCVFSTPGGCAIYSDRPQSPCREFTCSWLVESEILPDWMRPDLSGAIVQLSRPWHGQLIISAIPVGRAIPERTLDWLKNYAQQNQRALIFFERNVVDGVYSGLKRFGFGPPSFRRQVANMTEEELSSGMSMASAP